MSIVKQKSLISSTSERFAAADFIRACSHNADRPAASDAVKQLSVGKLAETGSGIDLKEADLRRLNLSGFDLSHANLNRAILFDSDLSHCVLTGASLICSGLERTSFANANLQGCYIHGFAAQVCNFSDADLSLISDGTGSLFHGCSFRGARFDGASLAGVTFYQCDLSGASFQNTLLQGATFNECHIVDANFSGANLSQARFLKCSMETVTFLEASGDQISFTSLNCARALNLRGASFPGLSIFDSAFIALNARGLHAPGAQLRHVDLDETNLDCAVLSRSAWNIVRARDLRMKGAILDEASWRQVNVDNLAGEKLSAENFHAVDCTFNRACLNDIKGRALVMRNCSLPQVSAQRAYFYRGMITGDVPARANLRGADLQGAICVQAYITADLSEANLRGSKLAYSRLNQTILRNANLDGVELFQSSMVKTDVTGATISGLKPPFFADRVRGLYDVIGALNEEQRDEVEEFLARFAAALRGTTTGST